MIRNECPACSTNDKVFKYAINGYKINKCTKCRTLYVENVPELDELLDQYRKNDYYSLPIDSEQRINFENRRRARIINNFIKSGTVLDIGCAKGSFLNEMKKYNYNTVGIEMSAANVEICKENGHNVYLGDLDSFYKSNAKQKFDIIACLDVIEHIVMPNEFLLRIKSLLTNDGLLILSTPNFSGSVSKILDYRDPFIIPPEHLNFFTKNGLNDLVTAIGFKTIKSTTFGYLTKDGLERSVVKYLPKIFHPFSIIVKPALDYTVRSLNLFNTGLELELYLKNDSSK